ncbi:LysE family translocator [Streptomyces sp. NBC_01235]|uniref:LysE family translocator n=1 Tax=Streptomyces sp. NBC_01235 TaxID=2903788 RepID=UPI002E166BB5|nr:LysE family transporter [Streptomyces sp. NBC_01235]
MIQVLWLGALLGAGAALSVGPIFVTILQTAASRGFAAALRVILGSATADLILLMPALAFAWIITAIAEASLWVGLAGALCFLYLAASAVRDARRLWRGQAIPAVNDSWAFWKGVTANLANPLTWTFWLATGTPTMMQARHLAGWTGLTLFTITWFLVASGLEAVFALAVAHSGRRLGTRSQSLVTALSAVLFIALAATLVARDVAPVA